MMAPGSRLKGKNSVHEFASYANAIHPSIKVTVSLRWSKDKTLDT